jgi:hypothetical protein
MVESEPSDSASDRDVVGRDMPKGLHNELMIVLEEEEEE